MRRDFVTYETGGEPRVLKGRRRSDAPRNLATARDVGIGVLLGAAAFLAAIMAALWLAK
jgi:hypothetical protein